MFPNVGLVAHFLVVLGYIIITLVNLLVSPGSIQDVTLACLFMHAAALWASSLSELEISSRDSISSSPGPFSSSSASAGPSSLSPKKMMSRDVERDRSGLLEPLPGDPVPDLSSKL